MPRRTFRIAQSLHLANRTPPGPSRQRTRPNHGWTAAVNKGTSHRRKGGPGGHHHRASNERGSRASNIPSPSELLPPQTAVSHTLPGSAGRWREIVCYPAALTWPGSSAGRANDVIHRHPGSAPRLDLGQRHPKLVHQVRQEDEDGVGAVVEQLGGTDHGNVGPRHATALLGC